MFSSRVARKSGPLEKLGKVVVLNKIQESHNKLTHALKDKDWTPEQFLRELESLRGQHIALETLEKTKIGMSVSRLANRHQDERVVKVAKTLVSCLLS